MQIDFTLLVAAGLAIIIGIALFFSSRLQEHYGRLHPDEAVTQSYARHEIDPQLVYYTVGSDSHPRVLMGIDRRITLASDDWRRRDFTPKSFSETVGDMERLAMTSMRQLHGFEILDQRGRRMGTWFSAIDVRTVIRMLDDGRLRIDTPFLPSTAEEP